MNRRKKTSAAQPHKDASALAGSVHAGKLVTAMIGIVVALTFLFGFGNSFALGLRLGVPIFIAPLVAPAVDLSVVGLLLGIRQLALNGGPAKVQRSARRLLIFASLVTLALNIAEPLIAGHYGKAAFDAIGPLLMIGWAEVAPDLIQAMQTTPANKLPPAPPTTDDPYASTAADQPAGPPQTPETKQAEAPPAGETAPRKEPGAREQDLLHRARAEDVLHWQNYQRPISAETLRKRLHIGATPARNLVTQLRTDTHTKIENGAGPPDDEPGQAV
ncbi:hypothetical protein [Pseudofrankia asymbiotica]|uniref:DUF2637 domain-containing protein n=1 Tax=Pseudofrankia asymbiotica TaxID=1834516 RepID=A0A1V2HZA5_9ACTN|nr:hypothetical protein [Pseudofrankia asymbiotica]ONH22001.1 hypothetical protein BL253_37120 [Pseudofrankia asymbiotica]